MLKNLLIPHNKSSMPGTNQNIKGMQPMEGEKSLTPG